MIEYDAVTSRWVVKREGNWRDEVERWINTDNRVALDQVVQELKQSLEQSTPTYGEIKARDEGRMEIWNMMRRIMLARREESEAYTIDQIREAFGVCNMTDVLKMPLTDALAYDKKLVEKIKREREKPHVGDEVEFTSMFDRLVMPGGKDSNLRKGYVIDSEVDGYPECVRVLLKGDGTRVVSINTCKKTGKYNPFIVKAVNSL